LSPEVLDAVFALILLAVGTWFILDYGSCVLHLNVDLNMRFNEAQSVMAGKDPYLVWKGTIPPAPYTPFRFGLVHEWYAHRFIHAYPPWSYVFMMPFALLKYKTAVRAYWIVEIAALMLVVSCSLLRLRSTCGKWWLPCLCFALMCWSSADAITRCLVVGNYGIIITASAFVALLLQDRDDDCLAGIAWSITMVKPQLGSLFFLLLLLERKWRTLSVACVILLSATLLSAFLCGRSPIEMVCSIGDYSRGMFEGTGIVIPLYFGKVAAICGERTVFALSAIVGGLLCVTYWLALRHVDNLWIRFLPAMVFATIWTTFRLHDMTIQLIPSFVVVMAIVRHGTCAAMIAALLLGCALGVRGVSYHMGPCMLYANMFACIALYVFVRTVQDAERKASGMRCPCSRQPVPCC